MVCNLSLESHIAHLANKCTGIQCTGIRQRSSSPESSARHCRCTCAFTCVLLYSGLGSANKEQIATARVVSGCQKYHSISDCIAALGRMPAQQVNLLRFVSFAQDCYNRILLLRSIFEMACIQFPAFVRSATADQHWSQAPEAIDAARESAISRSDK